MVEIVYKEENKVHLLNKLMYFGGSYFHWLIICAKVQMYLEDAKL